MGGLWLTCAHCYYIYLYFPTFSLGKSSGGCLSRTLVVHFLALRLHLDDWESSQTSVGVQLCRWTRLWAPRANMGRERVDRGRAQGGGEKKKVGSSSYGTGTETKEEYSRPCSHAMPSARLLSCHRHSKLCKYDSYSVFSEVCLAAGK